MIRLIWLVAFCHLAIISIPLAVILPDVTIISAILAMIPWGGSPFLSLGDYLITEVPFFAPRLLSSSLWRLSFPMGRLFS